MSILDPRVYNSLMEHDVTFTELSCDPSLADTATFCDHYGFSIKQAANTIIVASKTDPVRFAACVVLGSTRLDVNKTVCKLMGVKKASFASAEQTKELTGMMIGGVTIFGLPDNLPIYVDSRVMEQQSIVMGGGNRRSKVVLSPEELHKLPLLAVVDWLAKDA
jgi:prolyl-tRNA editing enzyme YbaK/EbsC (Cys-tRNA(Pro) deacylase)